MPVHVLYEVLAIMDNESRDRSKLDYPYVRKESNV